MKIRLLSLSVVLVASAAFLVAPFASGAVLIRASIVGSASAGTAIVHPNPRIWGCRRGSRGPTARPVQACLNPRIFG
jgi:hypothetical protein